MVQAFITYEVGRAAGLFGSRVKTWRDVRDGRLPKPIERPGFREKPWDAQTLINHFVAIGGSREGIEAALDGAGQAVIAAYAKAKQERSEKASAKRKATGAKAGLVPANV